jgi:copper ion binding protein
MAMEKTVLNISGMGCSGCVNSVESALSSLKGVESASVSLEEETAEVSYDEARISQSDFEKAIEEAGYTMTGIKA